MKSQTTQFGGQLAGYFARISARFWNHRWLGQLGSSALGVLAAVMSLVGAILLPSATKAHPGAPIGEIPRFYIERVAVEGIKHASPQVIVSESQLQEGIAYSEDELRQAVYRIRRLPFVLDAAFSLGRGSERGRYALLINVEEVRSFFFGVDLGYSEYGSALERARADDDQSTSALTAGTRVFAGQGVFFAAVSDGEELQVGYERYRLLEWPIFLRLAYAREDCCLGALQEIGLDPGAAIWTATSDSDRVELTLGVPLFGNHSLRLDVSRRDADSAIRRRLDGSGPIELQAVELQDVERRELELAWVFDSTDDPVFPTRGDALTAAVGLRWLEGDLPSSSLDAIFGPVDPLAVDGDLAVAATEMSSRLIGLSFYGARHWPLSPRQTLSLSLKLLASRSEVENLPTEADDVSRSLTLRSDDVDTLEAGLGLSYSLGLRGPSQARRRGELRWETVAGLVYIDSSSVLGSSDPLWGLRLTTGVALRNSWGLFRLGLTFVDYDGEL